MSRRSRIVAVAAAAVTALVCALPGRALASATQTSSMMDDDQLIYASQSHMVRTLTQMHSLGVDIVKVSMVWQLVAPGASSSRRPRFNATNPSAYPQGAWNRWDALVQTAQRLGMRVYLLIIGPAPRWAIPGWVRNSRQGPALGQAPRPGDYQDFVEAVGRRYSGAYVDPSSASPSSPSPSSSTPTTVQGVTVPSVSMTQRSDPPPQPGALPRVDFWGIWNEPNERSWMNPWYRKVGGGKAYIQPEFYRSLVDAGWNGLSASSHASDTIMIGETANRGILTPAQFVRGLYCVGSNLRPLRGNAARNIGCPTSGTPSQFAGQHPGLFQSAGYAHHPYTFDVAPNRPYPDRTFIGLYNLGSFERLLTGIFSSYGVHPRGGVPLYLTEWGEKSNPPNPYVKTTTAEQAAWIDQGDYMTWRMPYVRQLNQFLLVDSPPKAGEPKGSVLYWSTFQTGLETLQRHPKPALQAYQIPIWLPVARHGRSVAVWGQLRPADHSTTQDGVIEYRRGSSGGWRELAKVQTKSPEGFLYNHVSIPSAGQVRLGWLAPSGAVVYSRAASVS